MNLLILLFVVTFASAVVHSQVCTGFGSGTVGSQYIYQHYSGAVLRVQDVGTAFLIDSERGYLLTAGHVLDDLAFKKESLEVIGGDYPYSHLQFALRYRSPDVDVALLQLTQPDALKNVLPLDIAFDPPDLDTKLVVMGYPQFGQQGQIFRPKRRG
jgi:S1-C subfamily serine protease